MDSGLCIADASRCSYLSFVFAKPVEDAAKRVTGTNFEEGKLVCQVRTQASACKALRVCLLAGQRSLHACLRPCQVDK